MTEQSKRRRKTVAELRIVRSLPDGLWEAEHVGAFLKVCTRTVYDLPGLVRTEIPCTGSRPKVRWHPDDVKEWARRCRKVAS